MTIFPKLVDWSNDFKVQL